MLHCLIYTADTKPKQTRNESRIVKVIDMKEC